jgi:hypothetical protein
MLSAKFGLALGLATFRCTREFVLSILPVEVAGKASRMMILDGRL